jgi:signal peptidase I
MLAAFWISGIRLYAFPGQSMSPAVQAGDHFIGLTGLWNLRLPRRFDMVIFDVPVASHWAAAKIPWMKRVIGLPGEQVRLSGSQLYINDRAIDAPFLHSDGQEKSAQDFKMTLGKHEYCVVGDNLNQSFDDSRSLGPIDRSLINGFVGLVLSH